MKPHLFIRSVALAGDALLPAGTATFIRRAAVMALAAALAAEPALAISNWRFHSQTSQSKITNLKSEILFSSQALAPEPPLSPPLPVAQRDPAVFEVRRELASQTSAETEKDPHEEIRLRTILAVIQEIVPDFVQHPPVMDAIKDLDTVADDELEGGYIWNLLGNSRWRRMKAGTISGRLKQMRTMWRLEGIAFKPPTTPATPNIDAETTGALAPASSATELESFLENELYLSNSALGMIPPKFRNTADAIPYQSTTYGAIKRAAREAFRLFGLVPGSIESNHFRFLEIGPSGRGLYFTAALLGAQFVLVVQRPERARAADIRISLQRDLGELEMPRSRRKELAQVLSQSDDAVEAFAVKHRIAPLRFDAALKARIGTYGLRGHEAAQRIHVVHEDAASPRGREAVQSAVLSHGGFTHLVMTNIISVPEAEQANDLTTRRDNVDALFNLLAAAADPHGAKLYFSVASSAGPEHPIIHTLFSRLESTLQGANWEFVFAAAASPDSQADLHARIYTLSAKIAQGFGLDREEVLAMIQEELEKISLTLAANLKRSVLAVNWLTRDMLYAYIKAVKIAFQNGHLIPAPDSFIKGGPFAGGPETSA